MKKPTRIKLPVRLHQQDGRYYWKPESRLRPHWRTTALGVDQALAIAEARRLNKLAAEWLAIEQPAVAPRRAQPRTVGELIELWRNGPMKEKAARTRQSYDYELGRLAKEFGHEAAATLDTIRVDEWADALRKTAPQTLRHVASRGRTVFVWAARKGYIPKGHNPFREMNLPGGGRRSFRFAWDDVRHIIAVAEAENLASLGHALAIGFMTIQRASDVLALTEADIVTEGAGETMLRSLRFAQSKTGFQVDQEWPDILDQLLGLGRHLRAAAPHGSRPPRGLRPAAVAGSGAPRPLIVSERSGRAWDGAYASRIFSRLIEKAIARDPRQWKHLRGGQLRDGRRSGFVHCYEAGRTMTPTLDVPDICAMSGHSLDEGYAIIEHYLPKTRKMADRASLAMRVR